MSKQINISSFPRLILDPSLGFLFYIMRYYADGMPDRCRLEGRQVEKKNAENIFKCV